MVVGLEKPTQFSVRTPASHPSYAWGSTLHLQSVGRYFHTRDRDAMDLRVDDVLLVVISFTEESCEAYSHSEDRKVRGKSGLPEPPGWRPLS